MVEEGFLARYEVVVYPRSGVWNVRAEIAHPSHSCCASGGDHTDWHSVTTGVETWQDSTVGIMPWLEAVQNSCL